MPRPKNNRIIHNPPLFKEFKPIGVRANMLKQTIITIDEFEAFRLADYVGLSHEEAALEMEISRSTFTRLIEISRRKIAELIVHGNMLSIEGGNIHFRNNIIRCLNCEHMFNTKIELSLTECPECTSANLLNLAGGFGHGKCCYNRI